MWQGQAVRQIGEKSLYHTHGHMHSHQRGAQALPSRRNKVGGTRDSVLGLQTCRGGSIVSLNLHRVKTYVLNGPKGKKELTLIKQLLGQLPPDHLIWSL